MRPRRWRGFGIRGGRGGGAARFRFRFRVCVCVRFAFPSGKPRARAAASSLWGRVSLSDVSRGRVGAFAIGTLDRGRVRSRGIARPRPHEGDAFRARAERRRRRFLFGPPKRRRGKGLFLRGRRRGLRGRDRQRLLLCYLGRRGRGGRDGHELFPRQERGRRGFDHPGRRSDCGSQRVRVPGRPRAGGASLALATRGVPGLAAAVHLVAPRGNLSDQRGARDVPAAPQVGGRVRRERVVLVVGRSGRAPAEPSLAAQTGRRVPVGWVARPAPRRRRADRATIQALHARACGVKLSSLQVHPPAG